RHKQDAHRSRHRPAGPPEESGRRRPLQIPAQTSPHPGAIGLRRLGHRHSIDRGQYVFERLVARAARGTISEMLLDRGAVGDLAVTEQNELVLGQVLHRVEAITGSSAFRNFWTARKTQFLAASLRRSSARAISSIVMPSKCRSTNAV